MPKTKKRGDVHMACKEDGTKLHRVKAIKFYSTRGEFACLSNFSRHPVEIDGRRYPTTEHYYQSQKAVKAEDRDHIASASTPTYAKKLGRECEARPDWDAVKEDVMRKALREKFGQNYRARLTLLSTGDAVLIERSPKDAYWGDGPDGNGLNRLGHLLVETRKLFEELDYELANRI